MLFLWKGNGKVKKTYIVEEPTDEDGNPTDEYPDWVQPTGYENVYKRGDIVKHDSKVWILDADTSAHEPGTTHSGWVAIP